MKIIIELDSSNDQQPEIRRATKPATEQEFNTSTGTLISSSAIDAGQARMPERYGQDSSAATVSQQSQGVVSFSAAGVLDAGAARIQDQAASAFAMPDTGNMETISQGNAFSAGTLANTVNN